MLGGFYNVPWFVGRIIRQKGAFVEQHNTEKCNTTLVEETLKPTVFNIHIIYFYFNSSNNCKKPLPQDKLNLRLTILPRDAYKY